MSTPLKFKLELDIDVDKFIKVIDGMDQLEIPVHLDDHIYSDLIQHQRLDILEFLIDRSDDPLDLFCFCYEDDIEVIKFLIEKYEAYGGSAGEFFIIAVEIGLGNVMMELYKDRMQEFLEYDNGRVLNMVTAIGDKEYLKLFLIMGARIEICLTDPINDALVSNHMDLIKLLMQNGSDVAAITADTLCECIKKHNKSAIEFIETALRETKLEFSSEDLVRCMDTAIECGMNSFCINLFNSGSELSADQIAHIMDTAKSMSGNEHLVKAFERILKSYKLPE